MSAHVQAHTKAAPQPSFTSVQTGMLQRKCACGQHTVAGGECEECRRKREGILQRAAVNTAPVNSVPPIVHDVLSSPGQPLDAGTRAFMEPRFGFDFSRVRVHTDARAAESAQAVNALAYTVGRDVVFGTGQYAPETSEGRRLVAHELTHTIQQAGAEPHENFSPGEPGSASEREADSLASEVASGKTVHAALHNTLHASQLQRAGLFESVARLFGGGTFSDQELQEYLQLLDKTNRIEDHYDSDNKAREIVRRWQTGNALYILPPRRKILLIQEMLTGFTSKADEQGILALLRGSPASEFAEILKNVRIDELRSNMEGDERKQLEMLVATQPGQQQNVAGKPGSQVFSAEKVLETQELFTYNADLGAMLEDVLRSVSIADPNIDPLDYLLHHCVDIVRTRAPAAFAQDSKLAERICSFHNLDQLQKRLKVQTLTMSEAESVSNEHVLGKLRLNCIDIVRTMVPGLFAQDPKLAERIRQSLSKLKGDTLTMPDAMKALTELGVAAPLKPIPFNNGNGNNEPTKMMSSAWDAIVGAVGDKGWHIFGLAVFNGYHSVTVFVDNRADGRYVYWADQWRIDPGEDFGQEEGSVSGFRRYEKANFDKFIEDKTREWWNEVHAADSKCGKKHPENWDRYCRYPATLSIWHLRSGY